MVTITGRDGRIVYASPATESVSGYTPEEFMDRDPFFRLDPPRRPPPVRGGVRETRENPGLSLDLEHRVRYENGEWHWVEGTFSSLFDDPDVGGLVATVRDITGRKRAEEQSRRAADADAFRVALADALASPMEPGEIQAQAARVLG